MTKSSKASTGDEKQVSTRIFIGLIVGAIIGVFFNIWGKNDTQDWLLQNIFDPIGQAFLRSLFMIVVPLVFASLVTGVANLGSAEHVGRLGWRLGAYYVGTTLVAVVIGQLLVMMVEPGAGLDQAYVAQARNELSSQVSGLMTKSSQVGSSLWPGIVGVIIPKNIMSAMGNGTMLAIIFVAILFGVALLRVEKTKQTTTMHVFSAITDISITIVGWIMKVAPYAVAALMISAVSKFGAGLMANVLKYMAVVVFALLTHFLVTYSVIVKYYVKIPIQEYWKRLVPVLATAFSTSSSSATMPTTMRVAEKRFGVPKEVATFSIPLGTTVNMDGTALFEVVAALFVAQVFGVDLSFTAQISLILIVLFSSIGVAGVPGGSIPLLMSAMATVGIPPEGIAIVIGVDRLLDMCRTALNVSGDMTGALVLAKVEKVPLKQRLKELT